MSTSDPPPLSPHLATFLSILHTTLYVGILYLSPSTRPRRPLGHPTPTPAELARPTTPEYIRPRIRAVTVATALSVLTTLVTIHAATGAGGWWAAQEAMGLWPGVGWVRSGGEMARVGGLVAGLFVGSLWEKFVVGGGWRGEALRREWAWVVGSWVGWRNLVAGPVTEELVFRAAIVPLHVLAGRSFSYIVWTTPLFFGIGHLHHLYEFLLRNPHRLAMGLIRTAFQFTYTTMFGWFATFVFLRTGSVWTVIVVHSFCNYIGVPSFGRIHDQGWDGGVWGGWVDWVHWGLHCVGLWGFWRGLWWATEGGAGLMGV